MSDEAGAKENDEAEAAAEGGAVPEVAGKKPGAARGAPRPEGGAVDAPADAPLDSPKRSAPDLIVEAIGAYPTAWTAMVTVALAVVVVVAVVTSVSKAGSGTPTWAVILLVLAACAVGTYVYMAERRTLRLRSVAEAATIALDRGHVPLRDAAALAEASGALTRGLPLDETLQVILSAAVGLLDGTEGSIMLADPDGEHLETICYRGSVERYEPFARVAIGEGIAGRVAATKKGMALTGKVDPGDFEGLVKKTVSIHSALCVPLVSDDVLIGVLNVDDTRGGRDFDEADLTTLQVFADDAAVAITRSAGII